MPRKHPDAHRGQCGKPHPEYPSVWCDRRPGDRIWLDGEQVHEHGQMLRAQTYDIKTRLPVTGPHADLLEVDDESITWQDERYGHIKWIELCGLRHRDSSESVCTKPKGHQERVRSKERSKVKLATKADIEKALRERHKKTFRGGLAWVYVEELRIGRGFANYGRADENNAQRIDGWAMHLWPSRKHERIAYEIKVDKQDFKNEVANPSKRLKALEFSNRFYFVVPKGMVSAEDIPEDCGLMVFNPETKKLSVVVSAPWREGNAPTWSFIANVILGGRVATR